jgi:hypothetical protein
MSTSDAFVWVMCDSCNEQEEAQLPFVYPNDMLGRNGKGGRYDHANPHVPKGWEQFDGDKHECPSCVEARAELSA